MKKLKPIVCFLILICVVFSTTTTVAYADGDDLSQTITTPLKSGLGQVYKLLTAIILPIAVIVIAICAIQMIWGSTRSGEVARSTLIRVVIALAIIYLAPLLVRTISGWFSSYANNTQGIFS